MAGYEIAPSEFWRMTPKDFWLIYDGKIRQQELTKQRRGRWTREEYEDFRDRVEANIARKHT